MKKLLFIICLFIAVFNLQSYAYDTEAERALLRQLNNAPKDSTRLQILDKLTEIVNDASEVRTHYIKTLLEEAEKQKNNVYICKAYLQYIFEAYNMYDAPNVKKWIALLEPIARKEKLYDMLFEGKSCAINILSFTGEYEQEEKEAYKMLKEAQTVKSTIGIIYAYQSLGYVQAYTYKYDKAIESFETAFAIASKANHFSTIVQLCDRLIEIYTESNNKEKQFKYIQELDIAVHKYLQKHPELEEAYQDRLGLIDVHYLQYYTAINQLDMAQKYFAQSERHYIKAYPAYEQYYHEARLKYFKATKQYNLAIAEIDTLVSITETPITVLLWKFSQAKILSEMGKEKEAIDLYRRLWPRKDSIQIALVKQQTAELKKRYDADHLQLEQESINKATQLSFIVLIIFICLILIWFMIHTFRTQRNLSKAEKEQRRMSQEMQQASLAKERFLSNISATINIPLNLVVKSSLALASNQEFTPEERQKASQTITSTSAELMKLINNILDLSKLEAGMMKYSIGDIEVVSMLRSIIDTTPIDGHLITSQLPQNCLIWIKIDSNRLIQLIKTLIEQPLFSDASISVCMEIIKNGTTIQISVLGSLLSTANPTQEIIISNEINNMIINQFKGKYEIQSDKGLLFFTLPIIKKIQNMK